MKKVIVGMSVGIALLNAGSVFADSCNVGCQVTPVPEPSSFVQLAAGLIVMGVFAFIAKNRFSNSEAR